MLQSKKASIIERKGDRRKKATPFLSKYTFRGRRRLAKRKNEQYNYYIDKLAKTDWIVIGIIVFLSISDSLFTLHFLNKGFYELNPLMKLAITINRPAFILFKYSITIIAVLILGLHKNFRFV